MKALNRNEMKKVDGGYYPVQTCRITVASGTTFNYNCSMTTVECIDQCYGLATSNPTTPGAICGGCSYVLPY